ncbi:hypothetical protein [Cyanobacterium aponinum]
MNDGNREVNILTISQRKDAY